MVHRRVAEGYDVHGNPQVSYADPVPVSVYGIAPRVATEDTGGGRDYTVETSWDIYAPLGVALAAFDRITLPTGETAEIIGDPKTWQGSPFASFFDVTGTHFVAVKRK